MSALSNIVDLQMYAERYINEHKDVTRISITKAVQAIKDVLAKRQVKMITVGAIKDISKGELLLQYSVWKGTAETALDLINYICALNGTAREREINVVADTTEMIIINFDKGAGNYRFRIMSECVVVDETDLNIAILSLYKQVVESLGAHFGRMIDANIQFNQVRKETGL